MVGLFVVAAIVVVAAALPALALGDGRARMLAAGPDAAGRGNDGDGEDGPSDGDRRSPAQPRPAAEGQPLRTHPAL